MNRVIFLIDGFNIYHSTLDLMRHTGYCTKWLDLASLMKSYIHLFGKDAQVQAIHYFSAIPYYLGAQNPGKTLLETIKNTQEIISKNRPTSLGKYETLQIPKFDFDIEHSFVDIEKYMSSLVEGPAKAYQRIKYKLDEKGAILKSEATILVEEVFSEMPRQFIAAKPFLIYLRQKDSPYPYFAMWIENGEILKRFR